MQSAMHSALYYHLEHSNASRCILAITYLLASNASGGMGNGHPVSANSDIVFGYQILLSEVLLYCLPKKV